MNAWIFLFALAQEPPAEEKKKAELSLDMYGAHLKSEDYEFLLAGRYVFIGRFVEQRLSDVSGPANSDIFRESGWFTRQARLELSGEIRDTWEFKVSGDFVATTLALADGYFGYIGLPFFKLRIGQMKVPLGLELFDSFLFTTMIERSMADSILPGRELGAMAWGMWPITLLRMNEWAMYQIMTGKGSLTTDENKSVGAAGPADDELNFMVQMVVFPGMMIDSVWTKNSRAAFFHEVGLGAGSPIPNIRTPDTGTIIIEFAPTVVHRGQRERDGVWFSWGYKNFGLQGQWYRMDFIALDLPGAGVVNRDNLHIISWFIDACWIITGEEKVFGERIVPVEPLDKGGAGAWEVALRFQRWENGDINNGEFSLFTNNPFPGYTRVVINHTFGVNWWPHTNIRASLNFVYNLFEGPIALPNGDLVHTEVALLVRFQFGF